MTKQELIVTLQNEFVLPRDPHLVDRFTELLDEYENGPIVKNEIVLQAPTEATEGPGAPVIEEAVVEPEGEVVNG